jgi:hypothetical protein
MPGTCDGGLLSRWLGSLRRECLIVLERHLAVVLHDYLGALQQ